MGWLLLVSACYIEGLPMNKSIVVVAMIIVAMQPTGALTDGSQTHSDKVGKESVVTERRTIEQVQDAYTDEWMAIPGVEGTGIGLCGGKPCIKVYSSRTAEELQGKIPPTVEGYPVTIEETGTFRALE